ncbi:MAG: cysteine synthase family protein [Prevotellaceae bacterium]|jgi:cysteine synthase A|nr:cysteine synthase family protein [Prevotellaceae bacterium]
MKPSWNELSRLIGNTPMIGIHYRYQNKERTVYVKCEHYNLTGSIKDRMALYILRQAYESGSLTPDHTIVEVTSGNTGISFAALGSLLGHRVRVIMPDWMSEERKLMIKSYGAEIIPVSKEQGGFLGSLRLSQEMAKADPKVFLPCQFSNEANSFAHQETTGHEIRIQLAQQGLTPTVFVAGVGTGGTLVGVGRTLQSYISNVKIHPLEPEESPTITTGYKVGAHRIQGISDEFIPAILQGSKWDEVVQASDGDAILMAQQLASTLGLGVGISSGANLIGAIKLQALYGDQSVVATVFPDSNKKYLTTDLTRHEPVKAHYISPQVALLGFCVLEKAR